MRRRHPARDPEAPLGQDDADTTHRPHADPTARVDRQIAIVTMSDGGFLAQLTRYDPTTGKRAHYYQTRGTLCAAQLDQILAILDHAAIRD